MSRGVVLWPEQHVADAVRSLWDALTNEGIPNLATHTHRLHQPHCSLSVAEELPSDLALEAVGTVPTQPIPLVVESVSVFPPNGALVLACVANERLLAEQQRVHRLLTPIAVKSWPYFEFNAWVPHITLSPGMTPNELATAIPIVTQQLPIKGMFDHGGVEDGTTGENWPAPRPG